MKQSLIAIIIALIAAIQMSCGDKEEHVKYSGAYFSQNLISCYLDCDEIILQVVENRINVLFDGKDITAVKTPAKFDSLAKVNNDVDYNDLIVSQNISINDSISSICIKCDKDIDANHLAGSELNDLFTFKGETYYTVIKNHYDKYEADSLQMSAKDVTSAKTRVMCHVCSLTLDTPPAKSGTYTFDVTIKLSKKTLTNTVTMEF
ncbi:MAG: hypothetical protein J6T96_01865 [Bacteroidales bacterium]|nr:hypothetical protein [Bacteroidales bacterium]